MKDMCYSQQNGIVLLHFETFFAVKNMTMSPQFSITDRQLYCQADSYGIISFPEMLKNLPHCR